MMKAVKKIVLLMALIVSISFVSRAQDMIFTLDYNFAWNIGDFEEFIPEQSYRGGHLHFTKFLESNENLGVGLSIDWQGFYVKQPRSTFAYYDNNGSTNSDINAVQFRYMYTSPIKITLDYYFVKDAAILPFIGINAGVQYTEQELNVGALENRVNTAWDFAFGAQAGIHMPFGESGVGLNVIGKYNGSLYEYTFSNIDFKTEMGSYFSLGLGLSFLMEN